MTEVVIAGALRTAVGSFGGSLSKIPAPELGATVIRGLMNQFDIRSDQIDEVIMGQVLTAISGQNPARQASIFAGLDESIPSFTINKVCGSGMKAIQLAQQAILCGDAEMIIAGGQENMSLAPHCLPNSRTGKTMGDIALKDSMVIDGLWDAFNDYHMGMTAENIADQYQIDRQQQDELALASQQKAENAIQQGYFDSQIVDVNIPQRKQDDIIFRQDEFPRKTTIESLASLRAVFKKDGSVTAGNASGINDGAAAVIVCSRDKAEQLKLPIYATIKSIATTGVSPKLMGTGPVPASMKALSKAGWTIDELDLIESNEAFAVQASCVNKMMRWDSQKVNPNGGAIALGHPIGASGCRIVVSLLHEMRRTDVHKGLATLCIGGGQGIAITLER